MSVYRPKKSPFYQYDFVWKGARFHGSTGTGDREEAKAVEAAVRKRAVRAEYFGTKEDMTLDAAADLYWTQIAAAQPSARSTKFRLANLIRLIGADTLLSRLTDEVVAACVARRRGEPAKRRQGMVAPGTVNREVELLRRVMRRAARVHKVAVAEVDWSLHRQAEPDSPANVLTEIQEVRLLAECANHIRPIVEFALLTGLRKENILRLDWSQIDLTGREITFHVKSRKPGGRLHILPVTDEMLVMLANLGPRDKGPVFTHRGKPIKSIQRGWENALRRAGISMRFHDLRHTVGSRLVARGVDVTGVQEVLGHADIASTMRYVHHKTAAKMRAMDLLSRTIPEPKRKRVTSD